MKSSANRGTGSNRPPVRSASLNRNNNAAPGAVRTPSAPEMYGFTEEPYRDMSQQYQGATPVEEPFDYSMMGKPNKLQSFRRRNHPAAVRDRHLHVRAVRRHHPRQSPSLLLQNQSLRKRRTPHRQRRYLRSQYLL